MATALTSFYPGIRVHIQSCPTALMEYYTREVVREFCKETLIYQDWVDYINLLENTRSYTIAPPTGYLLARAIYAKVKHTASSGTITAATQAEPVVITSVDHGLSEGARVYVADAGGMTEINDLTFTVGTVTDDTFELDGIDGSGYTEYTTGGTWNNVSAYMDIQARTEGYLDGANANWRIDGSGAAYYFNCPSTETIALSWNPAEAVPNGLRVWGALMPTPAAAEVPDIVFNDWHDAIEAGVIGRLMSMPRKAWTDTKESVFFFGRFHIAKRDALGDRLAGNTHRAGGVQGAIGAYT